MVLFCFEVVMIYLDRYFLEEVNLFGDNGGNWVNIFVYIILFKYIGC